MHREPCMDILCLSVNLCQTHCVPSVNLSHECFPSAAYPPLKGNERQAWPLTRASPANQHSATLAASPHQITTAGCKGNSVWKDAMKETIIPPSQITGWSLRIKTNPKSLCRSSAIALCAAYRAWSLLTDGRLLGIFQRTSLVCIHWIFVIITCPQESTVITCVHKASGDPTVRSAAPARMAGPALQRMAHVCVHLDTEERPAKEVSVPRVHSFLKAPGAQRWCYKCERGTVPNSTVLTLIWSLKNCWRVIVPGRRHLDSDNRFSPDPSSLLSFNQPPLHRSHKNTHTHTHTHNACAHVLVGAHAQKSILGWETCSPRLELIGTHTHTHTQGAPALCF